MRGMVGGQAVDLLYEGKKVTEETLEYIHSHKTAALIVCCLRVGGILSGASARQLRGLTEYGKHLGLAFQIVDDILDVESSTEKLGKTVGKDVKSKKATYPSVFGMKKSRQKLAGLAEEAGKALVVFGARGRILERMIQFIIKREK